MFYLTLLPLGRLFRCTLSIDVSMLCYAKSLQSCPTLCDPIDGSPPGSPSLGFSRQEHWSGLPFPSSMHESEKWKCRSVVSDSSRPHGLQPTRLLHPWDFPGKSTGVGCHCLLRRCVYMFISQFPNFANSRAGWELKSLTCCHPCARDGQCQSQNRLQDLWIPSRPEVLDIILSLISS